jgi:hypothetical protein
MRISLSPHAERSAPFLPGAARSKPARIASLRLLGALGAAIVVALACAYPGRAMLSRQLVAPAPNALSLAYLRAWLRVRPDAPQYLNLLALQYLEYGDWVRAQHSAERLAALGDASTRQRARLLELVLAERQAAAAGQGAAQRGARVAHRALLAQTLRQQWDQTIQQWSAAQQMAPPGAPALASPRPSTPSTTTHQGLPGRAVQPMTGLAPDAAAPDPMPMPGGGAPPGTRRTPGDAGLSGPAPDCCNRAHRRLPRSGWGGVRAPRLLTRAPAAASMRCAATALPCSKYNETGRSCNWPFTQETAA